MNNKEGSSYGVGTSGGGAPFSSVQGAAKINKMYPKKKKKILFCPQQYLV
jgi:hypothetical protein